MSSDLAFYLKRLRLSHMNEHLPPLLERAIVEEWFYQEFLTSLLEAEVFSREQQPIEQRIRAAHLPARKTLEQFDFSFETSVKRQVLLHLANLDFIQTRTNVLRSKEHIPHARGGEPRLAGLHLGMFEYSPRAWVRSQTMCKFRFGERLLY